ncbi:hypothetical protein JCGZ_04700 [Jatropha curcas]|uniref:Uncharacterized protein n=1 Tax=Jatropha curcas TaxID=180498 RepID=A0A067KPI4_JATCU|nr:hypothetical protein JCGZ_04700 [Jatropha curcas]
MESNSPTGKRRDCLKGEQHIQTQTSGSSCVENQEIRPNIEGIEEPKQHQKQEENISREKIQWQGQHIDVMRNVSGSCCDGGVKLKFVIRESEEKQQTASPCERTEIVCGLSSQHNFQLKNPTVQKMAASSRPVELHRDQEQHVKKNTPISSSSDPQHPYEQQPPKLLGPRRSARLKPETNKIVKSLLPSNDLGCDKQEQLEGQCNERFSGTNSNLVADATTALSSCTHNQNHNKDRQLQRQSRGRPRKTKEACTHDQNHNKEQQLQRRRRGRPRKTKEAAVTSRYQEQQQPQHQG